VAAGRVVVGKNTVARSTRHEVKPIIDVD